MPALRVRWLPEGEALAEKGQSESRWRVNVGGEFLGPVEFCPLERACVPIAALVSAGTGSNRVSHGAERVKREVRSADDLCSRPRREVTLVRQS